MVILCKTFKQIRKLTSDVNGYYKFTGRTTLFPNTHNIQHAIECLSIYMEADASLITAQFIYPNKILIVYK